MLPQEKRLKARDFKGKKPKLVYRGAFFDVSIIPSDDTTRFACIVSKKRVRRAVDRNIARRKMYALVSDIATKSPLLVLLYPTKAILQAPHTELVQEKDKAFATL